MKEFLIDLSLFLFGNLSPQTKDIIIITFGVVLVLSSVVVLLLNRMLLRQLKAAEIDKKMSLMRAQEAHKFQLAVENSSDIVMITDLEGTVIYANPATSKITGYQSYEVIGKKAGSLWGKQMERKFYNEMWDTIKSQRKVFKGELINKRKNGEKYIAEITITPIVDQQKIVTYYLGVERDITKTREVDRMKSEFLSLASHQLRTPLSAIKWSMETLMDAGRENFTDLQKELTDNINKSNEHMIMLVNQLLNISRIESGRLIIEPKSTDLKLLIHEVVDELQHRLILKNQEVELKFQEDLPNISIDPKLVRHVYMNLISNSIKYSPDGSKIIVEVKIDNEYVMSTVKDFGYGIPTEEQANAFKKFFRAKNIKTKETEGTGLGLYLVKQIINASQGKIWFESEENKGTTFYFSLPLAGSTPKRGAVSLAE